MDGCRAGQRRPGQARSSPDCRAHGLGGLEVILGLQRMAASSGLVAEKGGWWPVRARISVMPTRSVAALEIEVGEVLEFCQRYSIGAGVNFIGEVAMSWGLCFAANSITS